MTELSSEQLAPHSVEAEEAVLGSALINPDCLYDLVPFLKSEDFFITRHAWVWEALTDLLERKDAIDYLTVVSELEQVGRLAETGGAAFILGLVNKTPSALNAEGYGHIVERMALRRRLLFAAQEITRVAHSGDTDISEVLSKSEQAIFEVTEHTTGAGVIRGDVAMSHLWDDVSYRNKYGSRGIKTHLKDVDNVILGFPIGKPSIIAARPGMGKSAFLTQVALNNIQNGVRGVIFSLEMSYVEVIGRIAAQWKGINTQKIRSGKLNDSDWKALTDLLSDEQKEKTKLLYIDDTPAINPMHVLKTARRLYYQSGIQYVMIDYLQLMLPSKDTGNRFQDVSAVMRDLTNYARELREMPFVIAAQLSRKVENREDKRPMLSDLKESGQIEQDSEVVGFLYRDGYYDHDTPNPNLVELNIAKHRNGPTGSIDLYWGAETTSFKDLARNTINL